MPFLNRLRQRARRLKTETYALYLAYRDPRTPWYAKAFAACVLAYAASPIDLIPDFIPVLGYLDDVVLIPIGVMLAVRMIPGEVLSQSRRKARKMMVQTGHIGWIAAGVVVTIWVLTAALAALLLARIITGKG